MRACPVCECGLRTELWAMDYRVPDGWPLPHRITWYECDECGMIYGDGDFTQAILNDYYRRFYGYGVNNPDNTTRLNMDAMMLATDREKDAVIVDFGGAGGDGHSIIVDLLHGWGYANAMCAGPGDKLPLGCDVIYASHVLEHLYNLGGTMMVFSLCLKDDGTLIVDIPDATGLLQRWKMPILDFNTKHLNHFTLRHFLQLAHNYNFELVKLKSYELEFAPCWQMHFKRLDVGLASKKHVAANTQRMIETFEALPERVNAWGLGDITWHLLTRTNPNKVLSFIDNDPAYRGQTYCGKPVLERPDNEAPIAIFAQGQRGRLIEHIKQLGLKNRIVEI